MVPYGIPPTAPYDFDDSELRRDREKHGRCPTCGIQTSKIVHQFFRGTKLVPLTNESVVGGRCLTCSHFNSAGIVPLAMALPAVPILPSVQVMDNLCNKSSEPIEEDANSEVTNGLSTKTYSQNEQINNPTDNPVPDWSPDQNVSSNRIEQSENKRIPCPNAKKHALLGLLMTVIVAGVVGAVLVALNPPLSREQLVKNEIEKNVLQRNVKFDKLPQNDSRNSALDWLLHKDQLRLNTSDFNLNQRYILALFAFEFGSIFMSSTNWLSDDDECKWDGVTCLVNGEVNELLLDEENLTGTLPPEISKLPFLQTISMRDNSLFGSLPPELGNLRGLKELFLFSNQFNGTLPSEFGNLEELTDLSASKNMLRGTLPPELGRLRELTWLWLYENDLSGTLPSELGSLRRLTLLSLYGNQFTGTLPSEFGNLEELTYLSTSDNKLTGTFPPELCNLKELTDLWLFKNELSGTLPSELGGLTKLASLSVYENMFTGTIPSELGNLQQLTHLDLEENIFTGTIPYELGNINKLAFLDLGSNQLTGTVPSTLGDLQDLELYTNANHLLDSSQQFSMSMSM